MDERGREPMEELTLEPAAPLRRNHPRALWGVLGLVALAAGALVVTSSDGEGGQRPGLPVDLASRTAGAGEASADASMAAWVTYVAGDDLPSLGGEGTAYRRSGDVDEGRVRALAGVVGLDGEVERTDLGGWSVTGEGGLGRLEVYVGGGAYWSYFSGHQGCVAEVGPVETCHAEEECVRKGDVTECTVEGSSSAECPPNADCVPTTTVDSGSDCVDDDCLAPDGAPGAPVPDSEPRKAVPPPDDIADVALDVVAASGLDVDEAIVTGVPSEGEDGTGQWYVTVEPRLDGVPSGLLSSVEVSSDHRVLSGNGGLGEIEELGEYPLLDTRAAIDRANEMGAAPMPGVAARDAVAMAEAGSEGGGGGSTGVGGTTDCGGDGCATEPGEPTDTTMNPCKVQPDGREICEVEGTAGGEVPTTTTWYDPCPVQEPPPDIACTPPLPCAPPGAEGPPESQECPPIPEPQPIEVVLVDAERSLVLLPATDGSGDAYLVPAYRFTAEDGGQVDLPAVADEALAGPPPTDTTVPDTALPPPRPSIPEPPPCEILEEQDPQSATTHTVQTCPTPNEDPEVGVAHQVDAFVMDDHCTWLVIRIGDRIWWTPSYYKDDLYGWSQPTEAGTFTIDDDGSGEFVADADPERRATLVPWERDGDGPLCE